jgi:acyl-CoA thioesterase
MGRPKQEVLSTPEQEEPKAERFILKKNHGLLQHGRSSRHFAAGTEFDPVKDGELISQLAQSGAIFE